ncbi:MAG: hypothetical protein ABFD75_12365 [Smithella sp.]
MSNLGNLVISMSADLARLQSDMGKSVGIIDKASKEMASVIGIVPKAIGLIGAAAATLGGGKLFGDIVKQTVDWNENARKLASTLGVTTEQASIMEVAVDDIGLSHEVATSAALKLARTLKSGSDTFDQYGVTVKDANGNLLPMTDIMANVNKALLETKSGTDRNVMALALYGKSWGEIQGILRLTPERLAEAQQTAERLHLIVGAEGAAKTLQYKEALNEAEDAVKSLKIQVGNELIPELTRVAISFADAAKDGMPDFIKGIHSVEAEVIRLAMLLDKLGGSATAAMHYATGGNFTDTGKWWAKQNKLYETRYNEKDKELQKLANLEVGLDEKGNPLKSKQRMKSETGLDRINVDALNSKGTDNEKQAATDRAYLSYLKTFYESIAKAQKQHNEAEEQVNQIAYDWGIKSLEDYLTTKHALIEDSLFIDLQAKKKELAEALEAEKKTRAAYTDSGDKTGSADLSKAYEETQKAIMAVRDAEAQLQKQRVANADEMRKGLYEQAKGLNDLRVQIYDLTGQYEKAAKAKIEFYRSSPEYLKLSPAEKVEKNKLDDYSIFDAAQRERQTKRNLEYGNRTIANNIPDIWGNTAGPQASLKLRYDEEIAMVNASITTMDALYQKDTVNYQLAIERKKLLDQEYAANKKRMEVETWTSIGGIVEGQLGQLAGMMDQGNKEQFEAWKALAMAQAVVSTALAVVGILGAEAKLGVAAIPLAISAGAIGAAQVGIIAAQQYQGKAEGGAVNAGQTYWVGERGPELFTPGASGMITANDKIGGSVSIVNNNDFRNADPASEQRIKIAMQKTKEETMAAIYSSMQRGGSFAIASGRAR